MGSAVAVGRLGLVVGRDVGVADLEGVKAEAALLMTAHRARAGRSRWSVEEEVVVPVVVKVGDENLPRIGELDARVAPGVAREARVRFF